MALSLYLICLQMFEWVTVLSRRVISIDSCSLLNNYSFLWRRILSWKVSARRRLQYSRAFTLWRQQRLTTLLWQSFLIYPYKIIRNITANNPYPWNAFRSYLFCRFTSSESVNKSVYLFTSLTRCHPLGDRKRVVSYCFVISSK